MSANWLWALVFAAGAASAAEVRVPDAAEITQSERRPHATRPLPGIGQLLVTNYALEYYLRTLAIQVDQVPQASSAKPNAIGAVSAAAADVALTADMARALRIGTRANLRSNNGTVGAAIAFDVLGALLGGKSEQDVRQERWRELQGPSLYLVSLRLPTPIATAAEAPAVAAFPTLTPDVVKDAASAGTEDVALPASPPASAAKPKRLPPPPPTPDEITALDAAFEETVALLMSADLGCEPGQIKSTTLGKYVPRGEYRPGTFHARSYLCGAKDKSDLGIYDFYPQLREVRVTRVGRDATGDSPLAGGLMMQLSLHSIEKMKDARAHLDPDNKVAPDELPRRILSRLSPEWRSQWTAIFTSVMDGKRQVVVSNDAGELTFDMPKRP